MCKHPLAICAAIDALNDYDAVEFPKRFRRSNMKVLRGASASFREDVEADLSWKDLLARYVFIISRVINYSLCRFFEPAEKKRKNATSYNKFQDTIPPTKKQAKEARKLIPLEEQICSQMTCEQLRKELKDAGLSTAGLKADLVQRLIDHRQSSRIPQELRPAPIITNDAPPPVRRSIPLVTAPTPVSASPAPISSRLQALMDQEARRMQDLFDFTNSTKTKK